MCTLWLVPATFFTQKTTVDDSDNNKNITCVEHTKTREHGVFEAWVSTNQSKHRTMIADKSERQPTEPKRSKNEL